MSAQTTETRIAFWLDQHAAEYANWDDVAKNLSAWLESDEQIPLSWFVTGRV